MKMLSQVQTPLRLLSLVLLPLISQPLYAETDAQLLDELELIAARGEPALAARLLERVDPATGVGSSMWLEWQWQHLDRLASEQQWQELMALSDAMIKQGAEASAQLLQLRVKAFLALNKPQLARAELQRLIWLSLEGTDSDRVQLFRQQVIESYLQEARFDDARAAMVRYQQDYNDESYQWRLVAAETLLRSGRFGALEPLLAQTEGESFELLQMLAALRSGSRSPTLIWSDALAVSEREGVKSPRHFLGVAVEAAQRSNDLSGLTTALERYLALDDEQSSFFNYHSNDLWQAYQTYGEVIANGAQLLIGQDSEWLTEAQRLRETAPLESRALYASVLLNAKAEMHQQNAHTAFARMVGEIPEAMTLLKRLYLDRTHISDIKRLPESVRYQLVEAGMAQADSALLDLIVELETAPEGVVKIDWQLARAESLLSIKRNDSAVSELWLVVDSDESLDEQQFGQVMALLGQMRVLGQWQVAIQMQRQLIENSVQPERLQQLRFGLADLYRGAGMNEQAAISYLALARPGADGVLEPSAWIAALEAAEALQAAGLSEDAVTLYQRLHDATSDPLRRQLIERQLGS
ncbi:hypothetical protein BOW53_05135 [Solemya pervernicosa gill symbiont]|uniref:Tetratrico peptide repeat group 5 domain-containing protein n=2 Tax=Gammaproteobacteria incertae sedis TaxID=118884 RepID=A0A1T2L7M9_9GAMM|nr:hypothetical protein [Candidatus Reidiella endopervernicosa]OOZ41115.1 hypothetical protein BOW53_05135 [Solemya pervernicosa gill symbiont]QKQ26279.1 hypothetical protein HUE57_08265 [Candidatus Reidiella endopervernicosa]